ncbi:FtsX-like permease family protein [Streptomyces sp. 3MP-14]|uniref:FtsX-like permease family protein n=1 Tax=Streptomyces mimosae TaxID=2586635 RepID=A0A5N5ZRK8_9ACTN|nr:MULTISPECIES: FtsX-like permease family protein [Streptomyces]KAB8158356.1 FtsX-like permease family protein [Streptomyces mimosae]KAB8172549.1 FtsX-like permease family protein [Streptomyces sp. 3MP-14]
MSRLGTWRLALRVARRDALRAKGRSALVVAMIALPILGAAGADLALRSGQLSTAEQLERNIGQADARYEPIESTPVIQDFEGNWTISQDEFARMSDDAWEPEPLWETPEELLALVGSLVPEGSTLVYERSDWLRASTAHGVSNVEITETDAGAPLAEGQRRLLDGRYPESTGEVAASSSFLSDGGLAIGDEVTVNTWGERLDEGRTLTVVGRFEEPDSLNQHELVALPGAALETTEFMQGGVLVDVPGEGGVVDWPMVQEANESGVVVVSRELILDPPPRDLLSAEAQQIAWTGGSVDGTAVAVAVVAVSLIVLEVCLLAGPAFAVSARRSRRQLGLVGANGGERRHLRAIMLSSGLVLGAVAAVVGLVGGVLLVLATRPWLEERLGSRFGSWDFRWLELGGIAVLAVLIGLLAAVVPAYNAARTSVLSSLTGRRGVRRGGRVLPLVGGCALLFGTALALLGGLLVGETVPVAAGAVIAELGLVAMTPLLVGGFGRLARWLPLVPRLALRDAARNRGRTAPAVAAVLAAVAGAVAVATVMVSDEAEQRAAYQSDLPEGTAALLSFQSDTVANLDSARAAVERETRVDERFDLAQAVPAPLNCRTDSPYGLDERFCGQAVPQPAAGLDCPVWAEGGAEVSVEERRATLAGPLCSGSSWMMGPPAPVLVAEPEALPALGIEEPGAREALAEGQALVSHADFLDADGGLTLGLLTEWPEDWAESGLPRETPVAEVSLPARVLAEGEGKPAVLMSPRAAAEAGLAELDAGSVYQLASGPTDAEQQAVDAELQQLSGQTWYYAEEGFDQDYSLALLILALAATVITIGAAGIATGLAQADAAADLATLSAVGATHRLRRTLSGLQCGLIAAMGVLLGAVSGLVPAVGLRLVEHRVEVDRWQPMWDAGEIATPRPELFVELPWATFAQLLVVVPLVAWLLATLLTRSRVPLARRVG